MAAVKMQKYMFTKNYSQMYPTAGKGSKYLSEREKDI